MMPRWYSICRGNGMSACALCRRHVDNNGTAASQPQQGFTAPDLIGTHCNRFMESPPALGVGVAITPTDRR